MSRLYERTSKRCTASEIDVTLRAEVAAHAEAHQLGAGVSCWKTGLWSGTQEAASFYIGVGDDSEGRALLDELPSAVSEAKAT